MIEPRVNSLRLFSRSHRTVPLHRRTWSRRIGAKKLPGPRRPSSVSISTADSAGDRGRGLQDRLDDPSTSVRPTRWSGPISARDRHAVARREWPISMLEHAPAASASAGPSGRFSRSPVSLPAGGRKNRPATRVIRLASASPRFATSGRQFDAPTRPEDSCERHILRARINGKSASFACRRLARCRNCRRVPASATPAAAVNPIRACTPRSNAGSSCDSTRQLFGLSFA